MSHQFLSEEWMTAAKAIREKYADQAAKPTASIRMNQVITDVPFGEGTVNCCARKSCRPADSANRSTGTRPAADTRFGSSNTGRIV